MGVVYRAYHTQLERASAVKVLQGIGMGPDAVSRFHHEAQAIAQMRHPNIVNVFDFGDYLGTPYMIVEYVPGGNLADKLQQAPLDQATALKYLRGIASALDYAHSLGIVHRDVKPGNVLLEKDGTPVLADFGLVKLLQGSSMQSLTGVTTGTPAYMAPEQVTGHDVGPAADRYSLATMAYEMLTGTIPFDGQGVIELLYAHVHGVPPAPSSRNAALSADVDSVILRGLAKDPNARWESCAEFVEALTVALARVAAPMAERTVVLAPPMAATMLVVREVPPLAAPAKRTANGSFNATVATAMPQETPLAAKPGKTRRRLYEVVSGAAILLLLLVAGGICAATSQNPTLLLDPPLTVPGGRVGVHATHLPANQVGEVHLLSQLYTFPFRASAGGDLNTEIEIPIDIGIGGHHILLCWSGSCSVQAALQVVPPGTLPTPSPSASPSPTSTGNPTAKPIPGQSPKPGTTPTATARPSTSPPPTSRPSTSPSPKPTPKPTPTPMPNPCPTSTSGASVSGPGTVNSGSSFTVTGAKFTPNKSVTVKYYDPSNAGSPTKTWTGTVACSGSFSTQFPTAGNLLGSRTDRVTACDTGTPSRCDTYTFTLKAVLL